MSATIDRARLSALLARERAAFAAARPRSRELFAEASDSLHGGVPMSWMAKWAGGFPVFLDRAEGARVVDVDGHEYADLCLGDTGAMAGHAPAATVAAVREQIGRGATAMLPTPDAVWVGAELQRRFGLASWQLTLSATDANRFAIRIAREVTGRPKVLVFNWCYHGTVDEIYITLHEDGTTTPRAGSVGPPVDPAMTTRVVEWNDARALEAALAAQDVAVVLAEPALTNIGIVPPLPGFHERLRELTRTTGTLLLIDETHTLSAGPGGCTARDGLEPDLVVVGKAIAGGVPAGAYGMSAEIVARLDAIAHADLQDTGGVGGTLAGNALSLAAIRATLEHVLTDAAYAHTIPLAGRFAAGVRESIERHGLPWHVVQLGARAEYRFLPEVPRTGAESAASADPELEDYLHVHALNRGVMLTPFHNMALMCPATTEAHVDRHTAVFGQALRDLLADE